MKQYNYSLSGAATNSSLLYYDWGIDNDEISTNWVYWRPDPTINTYHHTDDRYFNYNTGTWQFDSDGPYSYYTVEYKNFNANVTWNGSSQGVPVQGVTHWMHEAYEAHPVYFLRFTNSAQTGNNDGYYYEYTKEYYAVMDVTNLWSDLKDQTPLTFTTPDDLSTVFAAVGQQVGDPLYANLADVPIQYVVGQDGAYWYSKNTDCFVEGVYLVVHPLHTNLEGITIS